MLWKSSTQDNCRDKTMKLSAYIPVRYICKVIKTTSTRRRYIPLECHPHVHDQARNFNRLVWKFSKSLALTLMRSWPIINNTQINIMQGLSRCLIRNWYADTRIQKKSCYKMYPNFKEASILWYRISPKKLSWWR